MEAVTYPRVWYDIPERIEVCPKCDRDDDYCKCLHCFACQRKVPQSDGVCCDVVEAAHYGDCPFPNPDCYCEFIEENMKHDHRD